MRPASRQHGFSLFELLIVLLLLATAAGVAAPSVGRFLDQLAFRRETGEVLAQLRAAKLEAISTGRAVLVSNEESGLRLSSGGREPRIVTLTTRLAVQFEPPQITFYPEGLATPAAIRLERGRRRMDFTIDPLTGLPERAS